jgi:hypothetical protein
MSLQTVFPFTLPRGYVDASGQAHQPGRMRLATARDEIEAYNDPRVLANEAYLPVVLLSRVIVQLGSLTAITPQVIEDLFASDLAPMWNPVPGTGCAPGFRGYSVGNCPDKGRHLCLNPLPARRPSPRLLSVRRRPHPRAEKSSLPPS